MESDRELTFMAAIAEYAARLDPETITRVLRWAGDRYKPANPPLRERVDEGQPGNGGFADVASFFHAVNAQSSADRALAIAYWFQCQQGQADFGAQEVNTTLKHLGHGVGNITETLRALMSQNPHLVIQKQKMGTSKQARKRYMVTVEGKRYVEQLLSLKNEEASK